MSQTEHNNISKIISISVAVLALILLLLYMQGSICQQSASGIKSTVYRFKRTHKPNGTC